MNPPRPTRGILVIFLLFGSGVQAAPTVYEARFSGAAEVPPNASAGSGFAEVHYDPVAHTLLVSADFAGLTGTVTAAHIHCCANSTLNGPVATTTPTFPGFPSGVSAGTYLQVFDTTQPSTYNAAFINNNGGTAASAEATLANGLAAGLTYFNIHSSAFPGGEIRGQLLPREIFGDGFEGDPP